MANPLRSRAMQMRLARNAAAGLFGKAPRMMKDITCDRSEGKASFILSAGGKKYKLSSFRSEAEARKIHKASLLFRKQGLPIQRSISRRGKFLLQEFIEGRTLEQAYGKKLGGFVEQIARLQARMHSIPVQPQHASLSAEWLRKRFASDLEFARSEHLLSQQQARKLADSFKKKFPKQYSLVWSQRDLNKANIIVEGGRIKGVIDIGDSRVEFRELDIARSIFMFGLSPQETKRFLGAYGRQASGFVKNREFWTQFVLLMKTVARKKRGADFRKPLKQLLASI